MKKIKILIACLVLPFVLVSQEKKADIGEIGFSLDGNIITLEDYIKLLLEKNHDVKSASYELLMTDSDYQKFKVKYAVYLNAAATYTKTKNPPALEAKSGKEVTTYDLSASATKTFETGTTLSTGISHQKGHVENMPYGNTTVTSDYNLPVLFVSLQQELLKNSFGKSDRSTEKMLQNAGEIKKAGTEYQLSNVILSAIIDYWNFVVAKSDYDNSKIKHDETIKVRNIVATNVNLGLAERFDLNYYNALVANAEASMAVSNQTYKESVRTLLAALNQDVDEAKMGNVVLCEAPPSFKEEDYLSIALAQRYDYISAKLSVENAKLQMGIYENSEAPSLKAGVTVKSTAMDEFSPAYSDAFSVKYPTVEAGLTMSYPLGDTEQKTNLRDSKYKYEQAKIALQKNEKDVRNDVKNKIENVEAAYNVMKAMERARIQSEEYYRLLLANLRRGRFSAITVKTALDARTDSRQAALRAKVNYNVALIQLEIASNNLLKKFGVKVKAEEI